MVKRDAEKWRIEQINRAISPEPLNLKAVKPKVESFNNNYTKPKFLKEKSTGDLSQNSSVCGKIN